MTGKRRVANKVLTAIAATLVGQAVAGYVPSANAQDASNPLEGLFTPQPQYPTPQTIMNPEPVPLPGQDNPIRAMFTPQPQYPTPQTIMNPQAEQPPGQTNPLNALFTPQPQYPTPQTIMNPEPVPKNYQPEMTPTENIPPPAPPAPVVPPAGQPAQPVKPKPKAAETKKKAPDKKNSAKSGVKAKSAPPAPPPVYNPLKDALFNINLGQYQTSIDVVNKVLENDPNNAEAHYIKAVALVFLQKFSDAAEEYRKVMVITPNSELGQRAEEGLKRINSN